MKMQGLLFSAEVSEISLYDISTGEFKPGYGVSAKILDVDTGESYTCQIADGLPGQDDLKAARKSNQPVALMQQVAAAVQGQLPPPLSRLTLDVKRIKVSKGFMTLVCSVESIGATV